MKIYNYHSDTGEFVGSSDANRDPLEEKVMYLIPANATTVEPPTPDALQVAVWNGTGWVTMPDHRWETWYNVETGEPVEIEDIGTPPTSLTPDAPPVPEPTYIQLRSEAYRDRIGTYKGFPGASRDEVIGFTLDAIIADRNGASGELDDITTIIGQVKSDIPKS